MITAIVKIILALIVGALSVLIDFSENNIIEGISIFLVATIFLFFDSAVELISSIKQILKRKRIINSIYFELSNFFNKFLNKKVNRHKLEIVIKNSNPESKEFYSNLFTNFFSNLNENIHPIYLCYKIDSEEDILKKTIYREELDKFLYEKSFDSEYFDLDDGLIRFYANYKQGKILDSPVNIDGREKILQSEFFNRYGGLSKVISNLYLKKEQVEEFRRTLSRLNREGKINLSQLNKDLQKKIKSYLDSSKPQIILFLSQNIQKDQDIMSFLESFTSLKMNVKYLIKEKNQTIFLYGKMIFLPKHMNYRGFFEHMINLSKKSGIEGFFTVHPFGENTFLIYPKNQQSIKDVPTRDRYNQIKKLKQFNDLRIKDIIENASLLDISINEISSIIPFNIFVPKIKQDAKDLIMENYDELRSSFKINSLSDWANIQFEDLGKKLNSLDKEDIYTKNYWEKISKDIINEAERHRDALEGEVIQS